MTKLFSIWFHFEETMYKALVTLQVKEARDAVFQVRILDQSLFRLIPQGIVSFSIVRGMQVPHELKSPVACELVLCITEAISNHISASNTIKV